MTTPSQYILEEVFLDDFPGVASAVAETLKDEWTPNYSASDKSRRNCQYLKSNKQLHDLVFESAWVNNDANGFLSAQVILESSHRSVTVQVKRIDNRLVGEIVHDVSL